MEASEGGQCKKCYYTPDGIRLHPIFFRLWSSGPFERMTSNQTFGSHTMPSPAEPIHSSPGWTAGQARPCHAMPSLMGVPGKPVKLHPEPVSTVWDTQVCSQIICWVWACWVLVGVPWAGRAETYNVGMQAARRWIQHHMADCMQVWICPAMDDTQWCDYLELAPGPPHASCNSIIMVVWLERVQALLTILGFWIEWFNSANGTPRAIDQSPAHMYLYKYHNVSSQCSKQVAEPSNWEFGASPHAATALTMTTADTVANVASVVTISYVATVATIAMVAYVAIVVTIGTNCCSHYCFYYGSCCACHYYCGNCCYWWYGCYCWSCCCHCCCCGSGLDWSR